MSSGGININKLRMGYTSYLNGLKSGDVQTSVIKGATPNIPIGNILSNYSQFMRNHAQVQSGAASL